LQLAEAGRLHLDDRALSLLPDLAPPPGAPIDPRLHAVTVRNLLQHIGGWGRDQAFDPMFRSREIARAMGTAPPAGADAIVRYMLRQPLQFAPGTRYAYSNFGYCMLGRIVERLSGVRYEAYVRDQVLRPAGVQAMRLGRSLPAARAPGEVSYYDYPGAPLARSVFGRGESVPRPYGGWCIEAMDAHGGWLASVEDMARFINAVDGRTSHPQLLAARSLEQMIARPAPSLWSGTTWYGMGWQVRPAGQDANWWHTGSLDGTITLMVRAGNGFTWVVFFNSRPQRSDAFASELDAAMWKALAEAGPWPDHDLFDRRRRRRAAGSGPRLSSAVERTTRFRLSNPSDRDATTCPERRAAPAVAGRETTRKPRWHVS
jgi:CubicO group peptidase (beta-lactamase class C family)